MGLAFVLFLGFFQEIVTADDFSDAFKEFILGSDSNTITKVDLLEDSALSQRCMQCHDGSSAMAITLKDANAPMQFSGYHNVNHSVGMNYQDYANKSPGSYVSVENLDVRIKLENGHVTCISCHEIKETEEQMQTSANVGTPEQVCDSTGKLTIESAQISHLCTTCHVR